MTAAVHGIYSSNSGVIKTITREGFFADNALAPTPVDWELAFGAEVFIFYLSRWFDSWLKALIVCWLVFFVGMGFAIFLGL